ncbi:MAG TPA: hypothetical protein VN671_12690 [Solirubrobacterales bacterium]|nr:hypothetical protein [Solirubrobacterales bacterium]
MQRAANRVPAWVGGLIVALLGWRVGMNPPGVGLDASWNAGLAMGAHDGLHWGTELVWTYGPLGFLQTQLVWFTDQTVLTFLYQGLLHVIFCLGLVWALRRRLPLLELSLLSAVIASFWLLEPGGGEAEPGEAGAAARPDWRSGRRLDLLVVLAATFAAPAALIKLSTGPLVPVVLLIALIGARVGARRVALFVAVFAAELLVLWLLAGQSLGDVPAFIQRSIQISEGYSSAMLRSTEVAAWKVAGATLGAVVISIGLVVVAWLAPYRDRRGRWAGTLLVALAAFAIYKEGVVRVDAGHLTVYFANACILWIAVGFAPGRRWFVPAVALLVFVASLPLRPAGTEHNLNPFDNLHYAFDQARNLASPGRRAAAMEDGRRGLKATYALEPGALAALRGHSVAVEPWEAGAAWAYHLDWLPQPIFQNYSAYTSALDRMNAATIESPDGPERLLRENAQVVDAEFPTPDIDNRFMGWDPPEQARAVLCNFAPLYTSERWQVLGRTPDRCGPERSLGSVQADPGQTVPVPTPEPGTVVFARVSGVGVSGLLERAQNFFLHARSRHAVVNGDTRYRLVPETAGDGLLMRAGPGVVESGPFDPVPEAQTIAIEGGPDPLTYDFFSMRVRTSPRIARGTANASG